MKRKLLYGGSALLSGLVATGLWLQLNGDSENVREVQALTEQTSWTPRELLQKEIEAKRKRREAGYAKADKPSEYTKFHESIRTKWGAEAPEYESSYKFKELQKARLRSKGSHVARATPLEWVERGPANVPGRTRGLVVLPDDPDKNTWLAGSVAGGIWKTADGGQSWVSLTPELSNMATTSLVSSAANPQIIYAGTGESFAGYNGVNGDGVFKSVDGGDTWAQLGSTADNNNFRNVNRLLVDQASPNVILAATSPSYWGNGDAFSKIMKSVDGGISWRNVYQAKTDIEQIVAHPDNMNVIYASLNSVGVIKSTDGGESWGNTGSLPNGGRIELAIAPTNPNRLYAQAVGSLSGTGADLFTSSNGGESWELVISLSNGKEYDFLGGQGWYDNTIAVNPYDENEAYLGGVDMFKVNLGEMGLTEPDILQVVPDRTASFLDFVSFGQDYFGGRLSKGALEDAAFGTVEVRFGPGLSQLAHRFTVPTDGGTNGDGGPGVPDSDYSYQDYVEVPFQVWDVTHNRQLMVSFRDQERDGVFNLKDSQYSDTQLLDNREYLYIHALPYETDPSAEVTVNGGQAIQQMYFFWPTLTEDASWEPANLPESNFIIEFGQREARDREIRVVADSYGRFDGPNRFSQQTNQTTVTGMHPDHHNITMIPVDAAAETFKILVGNDGGVFVSNTSTSPGVNEGDWTFAGNGYNTTQFYGIDKMPGKEVYIGGTQDNGTWRSPANASADANTRYFRALGGDGFEVVWNYDNPDMMMGSVYYNAISRTTNGGQSWSSATSGLSDEGAGSAPFITKLANHKSRPHVVYAVGKSGVWRTENFGSSWTLAPVTQDWLTGSFMDVEVSQANPYIVWAGSGMMPGRAGLHVSTDGGESFSKANHYNTENLGVITGVFTHPTEDSTAYALFSFAKSPKILRTRDLGQSWEDISGFEGKDVSANGFPDVAVYSLLVMPHTPEVIWAGTEIGLVESRDNGNSWALANNGLPNVSVWDMKIVDDQVVLGTHARGIWTVTIPELPAIVRSPVVKGVETAPTQSIAMQLHLRSAYDSVHLLIDGVVKKTLVATGKKDTLIYVKNGPATDKPLKMETIGYKRKIKYPSERVYFSATLYPEPITSYSTVFPKGEDAFDGADFTAQQPSPFMSYSLHTHHPYTEDKEYISQLRYPVIVAEAGAEIRYEDIALLEGAAEGAVFGEEAFNDYVVVEGTKDGLNWIPLADGYNSSSQEAWSAAYMAGKQAEPALFRSQQIDLHNTFAAGDTILVRFRMHTNATGNGYGWVIDNLQVQDSSPLGFNESMLSGQFSLEAFPNPATTHANIHFYLPEAAQVNLNIYEVNGAVVDKVQLGYRPAGDQLFAYQLPATVKKGQLLLVVLSTNRGNTRSVRILRE